MVAEFEEMADWSARFQLARAKLRGHLPGGNGPAVGLRMRELGGERLYLRPGTPDMSTIILDYVMGNHLPPPGVVDQDLRQVCELGSQVGTGVAGLAARFPRARVLGVEPDPENFALACRNVEPFAGRCRMVHAAIWDRPTGMIVEGEWESGYKVRPTRRGDSSRRRVHGMTIDELLDEHMPEGEIDYLVMTLEGGERRVLQAGGRWPSRVRALRTKFYPRAGFDWDEVVGLLDELGFDAARARRDFVFGIRRGEEAPPRATGRFARRAPGREEAGPPAAGSRRESLPFR
jgi:FkbM family methyltransferase